ncbi:MAG: TRAP transporter small permease [Deltaproteobacteria bacterium]|nr:TRAP transporter small permease [Deltaproteobacteria bacterium]
MQWKVERWMARSIDICLVVFISIMFISVLLQVFFRYVLEKPLSWSEELARFAFVWLSFIGAAMAFGKRLHFGIDYLVNKLPHRFRSALELATGCLVFIFILVLIVQGYHTTFSAKLFRSAGLNLRMDAVFAAIPVAGIIMAYYMARQIIESIRKLAGQHPSEQISESRSGE